jgi:hypothetical protein
MNRFELNPSPVQSRGDNRWTTEFVRIESRSFLANIPHSEGNPTKPMTIRTTDFLNTNRCNNATSVRKKDIMEKYGGGGVDV